MNIKTKKLIAKEIIVFFSVILLTLLFWGGTFCYNWVKLIPINKTEKEITQTQFHLDSLESLNPNISITIKENEETIKNDSSIKNSRTKLYEGLFEDGFYSDSLLSFEEFNIKYSDIEEIKKLYDFVHKEQLYTKSFSAFQDQFFRDLLSQHQIETTPSQTDSINIQRIEDYTNTILKLEQQKEFLRKSKSKTLSFDKQINFSIYFIISVLILVYPFRFLYLLLLWALRTIKQKE